MANAENNFQYDIDNLIVKSFTEKITMKGLDLEQKVELLNIKTLF